MYCIESSSFHICLKSATGFWHNKYEVQESIHKEKLIKEKEN